MHAEVARQLEEVRRQRREFVRKKWWTVAGAVLAVAIGVLAALKMRGYL
jgi:hypothetical protein